MLYYNGQGVPQDDTQAEMWFRKAAEQGYENAKSKLRVLEEPVIRWAVCVKNLETGKMVLITPDMTVDTDDPRFGDEVHIVPVVKDQKDPDWLSFGVHDFVRDCACHPKIEPRARGRTIISHRAAVN
jgi:TPR repeat protein